MRAVVESPRLVQLQGVNADAVSLSRGCCRACWPAWPACCIAPLFAQLDSLDFFTLLVAAIAAARVRPTSRASRSRSLGGIAASASCRPMLAGVPARPTASCPPVCARRCRSSCCSCCCCSGPALRDEPRASPTRWPASTHRRRRRPRRCARPWMTHATRVFGVSGRGHRPLARAVRARRLLVRPRDRAAWSSRVILLSIVVITGRGRHDLALPGDVRRDRRVHDRSARRRATACPCCSPWCSARSSRRRSAPC